MKKSVVFLALVLNLCSFSVLRADEDLAMADDRTSHVSSAGASSSGAADDTFFSNLKTIGKGTRQKKVVFVWVDVYDAEFQVSNAESFKSDISKPLDALVKQEKVALKMTFKRNVDSETMHKAFLEGLEKNGVSVPSENLNSFMHQLEAQKSFVQGKTYTLAANLSKGLIVFSSGDGTTTISAGTNDIKALFSIWLGESADSGLKKLKAQLLGQSNS